MTAPTDIPVNGDGTWRSPTWGEGGTYSPSAYEGNGAPQGTLIGPNDFNEPRRHVMRWVRAMRDRTVPSDRGLYASFLMKPSGGWNTGLGTLNGTIGVSYVMVDANDDGGVVVEFAVSAGSPHVFTASRDTYVNLNESGLVEYQAVANGAPAPTPSAGYVAIWKVVTDGTQLTSASALVPSVPVLKAIQVEDLTVTGDLDVEGDATVEGTFDVTGATTLNGSTTVDNDLLVTGEAIVQGLLNCNELEVDTASQLTGDVTCGAALTVTGTTTLNGNTAIGNNVADTLTCTATATFVNNVTVQGNTTLGNAGTDSLTVNATTTFTDDIDFGSNTITGALGTITTSTVNASTVAPTVINFQSTVQQSNDGRLVYDGRRLSIGDGSAARVVHHPRSAYVISSTVLGNGGTVDVTGASVQMVIEDSEWVYVRVSAKQTVTTTGQAPTLLVSASNGVDSVTALNNGDADVASFQLPATTNTDQARPVSFVTRWRPTNDVAMPNNTTWTLQVRHDVSGGGGDSLTTSNVLLEVWYE